MSQSEEIRKYIKLLETSMMKSSYDDHVSTTFEYFPANIDELDDSQTYTAEADVNYGRTESGSLSGNPEFYDLGEDDDVENLIIRDEEGNIVDPDTLCSNGAKDWKVYKIGEWATKAIYDQMEKDGHGSYSYTPVSVILDQ